jgi:hypothetical protein
MHYDVAAHPRTCVAADFPVLGAAAVGFHASAHEAIACSHSLETANYLWVASFALQR